MKKITQEGGNLRGLPIRFDFCDCSDVIFGGKNKFIVEHPFGFVIKDSGRMQLYHLIVLHRQIVTCSLQMRDLERAERNDRRRGRSARDWKHPPSVYESIEV